METGREKDYGLNLADDTPLYTWAVWHHCRQYADEDFLCGFLGSVVKAAGYLVGEMKDDDLLQTSPAGKGENGISSWRNVIADYVLAGKVAEINSLSAMALGMAAELTGREEFAGAGLKIAQAVNRRLWDGEKYLLTLSGGKHDRQTTGDLIFPLVCGVAVEDRALKVIARLKAPDFWSRRGLRTVPNSDPDYDPAGCYGLLGGRGPNLTLWYAYAADPFDADRALRALEMVAEPVVEPQENAAAVTRGDFPEYFDGETGVNLGMRLSPWVPPTFIWAVLEGLLGLRWNSGRPSFNPRWPSGWREVTLRRLPTAAGFEDFVLRQDA